MLYTHRTHSIINIVPQTAEFVYDLTTAEAVTAEFKHGLSASALDDAITSCSQVIATLCDRVFALQTVIEEFNIALWDHQRCLAFITLSGTIDLFRDISGYSSSDRSL